MESEAIRFLSLICRSTGSEQILQIARARVWLEPQNQAALLPTGRQPTLPLEAYVMMSKMAGTPGVHAGMIQKELKKRYGATLTTNAIGYHLRGSKVMLRACAAAKREGSR